MEDDELWTDPPEQDGHTADHCLGCVADVADLTVAVEVLAEGQAYVATDPEGAEDAADAVLSGLLDE